MIQAGADETRTLGRGVGKEVGKERAREARLPPDVLLKCSLRNGFYLKVGGELPISGDLHRTDFPKMNNVACVCICLQSEAIFL